MIFNIFLGFLDGSRAIRDLPLLHQLYKLIEESKEKGVSESESSALLGQSKLNGRALIKNLLKDKIIEYYSTSHRRQTVRRLGKILILKLIMMKNSIFFSLVDTYCQNIVVNIINRLKKRSTMPCHQMNNLWRRRTMSHL